MSPLPQSLVQKALSGFLIICANNKQKKALKDAVSKESKSKEFYPRISTTKSLIHYYLSKYYPEKRAVSRELAEAQFQKIISSSPIEYSVSDIESLSSEVLNARELAHQFQVDRSNLQNTTIEHQCFEKWNQEFDTFCLKNGFLLEQQEIELFTELFKTDDFHFPKKVCVYGFIESTPTEHLIFNTIEKYCDYFEFSFENNLAVSNPLHTECNTPSEEIDKAIQFYKQIQKQEPNATFCITSPILSQFKDELTYKVISEFGELDKPISNYCYANLEQTLFDCPEIRSLMMKLHSEIGDNDYDYCQSYIDATGCFSSALNTTNEKHAIPHNNVDQENFDNGFYDDHFVCTEGELDDSDWDHYIQTAPSSVYEEIDEQYFLQDTEEQSFEPDYDFSQNQTETDKADDTAPSFEKNNETETNQTRLNSENHLVNILELTEKLNWCIDTDNIRNQLLQKMLLQCLNATAISEFKEKTLTPIEFLNKLEKQMGKTKIESAKDIEYSLFIQSIDEIVGLNFDYIWILGTNADYWPPKPKSQKFLSNEIQKKYGISHNDFQITQHYEKVTERIIKSCYEAYYSSSKHLGEAELLEPSIFSSDVKLHLNFNKGEFLSKNKIDTEYVNDTFGTELSPKGLCPGGTRYIENYNNCSFMSHYLSRFKSLNTISDTSFAENKAHGDLIHHTLEDFWKQYKSTSDVRNLDPDKLPKIIKHTIERVVSSYQTNSGIPDWFFENEKNRLQSLITTFIELEMQRQFRVEHIEKNVRLEIEGLTFNLYIDRIEIETIIQDDVKIELTILSDHKSSKEEPNKWLLNPCPKPQLPIYSLAHKSEGCIFNIIRDDEIAYKGIIKEGFESKFQIKSPRKKVVWDDQILEWKQEIEKSVRGIKAGYSNPTPTNKIACDFCNLAGVCRKNEVA